MSTVIDPRLEAIRKQFSKVDYVLLVGSGKGGVGKSVTAATIALLLSSKGYAVGLLDLDLHGSVIPTIFDIEGYEPEESKEGLVPPVIIGVKVMSLGLFAKNRPVPIHGKNKRDAITELLAITKWGELDFLIVDLPPGTGDEVIASSTLIPVEKEALVIMTPSALARVVVSRTILLLRDLRVRIMGIVENMAYMKVDGKTIYPLGKPVGEELARELHVQYLGMLPFDPSLSTAIDEKNPEKLMETLFARSVDEIIVPVVIGNREILVSKS